MINVDDDGHVAIYHTNQEMLDKAKGIIEDLTRTVAVGDVYESTVTELRDSFAFVNLFQGTDALLHISEISWERTQKITDALHVGDKIKVKVISVDDSGKVKVSARECTEKPEGYVEPKKKTGGSGNRPANSSRSSSNKSSANSANVEKRFFKKKEA